MWPEPKPPCFVRTLANVGLAIDVTDYAAPMRSLPTKIGVAPTFNQITTTASRGEVIGLAARRILEWLYRRRASQPLARRWRNAAGKPASASTSRPRRRGQLSGLIGWPWQNSGSAPRNGWRLTLRWISGCLEPKHPRSAVAKRFGLHRRLLQPITTPRSMGAIDAVENVFRRDRLYGYCCPEW